MELQVDEPLFYRLTFNQLFRRTMLVLRRGAPFILAVSLVGVLPKVILGNWVSLEQLLGTTDVENWQTIEGFSIYLLGIIMTSLVSGTLVYAVFKLLREQGIPEISRSLSLAVRHLPQLVVASVVSSFLIGLSFMACILPGFVVMSALAVVAPVIMVEKKGPFEALSRSWDLTEGYRDVIFGFLFLIWLLGAGWGLMVTSLMPSMLAAGVGSAVVIEGLDYAFEAVTTALTACFAGVGYHDLRLTKEELGEDDLLAVFE